MASSPGYIRNQVLSLIEHQFFMSDQATTLEVDTLIDIEPGPESVAEYLAEPESIEPIEESESVTEDDS